MFRVSHQGEGIDDAETIEGARGIVRGQALGRCDVDEILAKPFPSGHTSRAWRRMVRFWEMVRYKWRRRKTLVRFVVLRLDHIWSHWVPPEVRERKSSASLRRPKTQAPARQQPRRVA
jgi:hypothetical protein